MWRGTLIAVLVVVLNGCPIHSQTPDPFKTAFERNEVFVLRDAVSKGFAPLLYQGAAAANANDVSTAESDLHSVIQKAPASGDAYAAHDLLGNMYFRNGMYREGYSEIVAAARLRPKDSDAESMLSIVTALNALPKMAVVESTPTRMAIEPDSTFLPLKANGKDLAFFFDTGANISVIGESEAKELGIISKPVEGKMGDASGQGVSGVKLAVISDLRIGGLHLQNVPFIVIADAEEPWNQLPKQRHGIIGIPVLIAMHTLRWSPAGTFEAGFPSKAASPKNGNMLFQNSNPVIDVVADGQHLNFTLDTGATDTDLNPAFAKALPSIMKGGKPESHSIEGLGGSVASSSILLPSVTFSIGGKDVILKPAHVFTEHGNGLWAAGNLGKDLLKQARAFSLDFGAMTLHLE